MAIFVLISVFLANTKLKTLKIALSAIRLVNCALMLEMRLAKDVIRDSFFNRSIQSVMSVVPVLITRTYQRGRAKYAIRYVKNVSTLH
jgi:hypothetical protein